LIFSASANEGKSPVLSHIILKCFIWLQPWEALYKYLYTIQFISTSYQWCMVTTL